MDLPRFADLPGGSAWGVFGADDQVGTLNLLGPAEALAGVREVRTGEVLSLNWRVDRPTRNAYRSPSVRTQVGQGTVGGRDDYLERFWLQYSSQWDGLRHITDPDGRFYNGVEAAVVDTEGSPDLGIQLWAERGIAGRGVLLDLARQVGGVDYATDQQFGVDVLDAAVASQGVEIRRGDILLVRTGWAGWYDGLGPERQRDRALTDVQPGLAHTAQVAAWLWDHRVAAVAADNAALEALPLDLAADNLHRWLIPGFGMPIGEYFWLDDLAAACAADRRWSFLFTSAPLNVLGGVGSPPNALALR